MQIYRLFILMCFVVCVLVSCGEKKAKKPFVYFRNYSRTFNDLNNKHLDAAKRLGIEPLASSGEFKRANRKLKKISSCGLYHVDELTHSIPYLVPEAYDLLEKIAENFKDSLRAKDLPGHKLIVTSVLRTGSSVNRLKKKNLNASSNSAHIYGTTFDIAYARYKQKGSKSETRDKLKTVLAEVLQDLRKQKRCYVRYEYKQGCFHITAR